MKKLLLTIVIINPYQSIDYDEPNLYIISEKETQKLEIVETLSDGYKEKPRKEQRQNTDTYNVPYFLQRLYNYRDFP